MVYLIWIVHPKIYNIGKSLKIQKFKIYFPFIFIFLNKDHQLTYFNMLVLIITLTIWLVVPHLSPTFHDSKE
jgi:hypothetical protein